MEREEAERGGQRGNLGKSEEEEEERRRMDRGGERERGE